MRLCAAVLLVVLLTACGFLPISAKPDISSGISSLTDATKALEATVTIEANNKPVVRRDEAIRYWISHGDSKDGTNFHSAHPRESFAMFVCAGAGSLDTAKAQMQFFKAYASGLQTITEPAPDTFAGQFARFLDSSSAAPKLELPEAASDAAVEFQSCFKKANALLNEYELGVPASDTVDELGLDTGIAVIEAGRALMSSLATLAKDGLKIINEARARERLKQYIENNRESLAKVEQEFLRKNTLDDAWRRRQVFVLGSAYEKFKPILAQSMPAANSAKLRAASLDASTALEVYDKMSLTPMPSKVLKTWMAASKQVDKAVHDDKVSLKAIIDYLRSVKASLEQMETDYKDVDKKFQSLIESLRKA